MVPVYLTALGVVSLYLSIFVVPVFLTDVCVVFQFTFLWYQFSGQLFCGVSLYQSVFVVPVYLTVDCGVFHLT